MDAEWIARRLECNGIPFQEPLPERLAQYLSLLEEWNTRMDLTAVEGSEDLLDRHMLDSLTILKSDRLEGCGSLIDVGTGAGFPGLVIAMAREEIQVTLLDAQAKRLRFLEAVCQATGMTGVTLVHARAEEGGRNPALRERFDVAAARALAPLNVLCEYLLPYVRVGGQALCWKGPALRDEMEAGRKATHLVGGRLEMPLTCPIAGRDWDHLILPIRKVQNTPKAYPRRAGAPKQKPLGI